MRSGQEFEELASRSNCARGTRAKPAPSCGKQRASVTVRTPERTADRTPHWDVL